MVEIECHGCGTKLEFPHVCDGEDCKNEIEDRIFCNGTGTLCKKNNGRT
jgi:hypothetical protein